MLQEIRDLLHNMDFTAWYYLNTAWRSDVQDLVVPFFRNQWTWAPLYLFLLVFSLMNYGYRGLVWCVFFLGTFALADQISAHVLKEIFQRTRPCNNAHLAGMVHIIVPCGSGYSFPSSHATNHFALGVFTAVTLRCKFSWIWPAALVWAGLVAYAQVYVGVHYPLDVACGGLLGAAIGMFTARLFHWKLSLAETNADLKAKTV